VELRGGKNSGMPPEKSSTSQRVCDPIDQRAGAFLVHSDDRVVSPYGLTDRLGVNSAQALEFENEVFQGRVLILHREPEGYTDSPSPYRSLFEKKRRRWELRWQGRFKAPVTEPVLFGAEIGGTNMPKFNFAMRTIVSLLVKFSAKLARSRGSDVFTNVVEDKGPDDTVFFRFPVYASDLILATPNTVPAPDLSNPCVLSASDTHLDGSDHFRGGQAISLDHTYTFVFYSMYADFAYWDLQHIPMGFSGMSLNRLVGNQPISVSMRSGVDVFFRMIIGNRCTSPEWASYLVPPRFNNDHSIRSEFYSAFSDDDIRLDHDTVVPVLRSTKSSWWLWRGFKRIIWTPTKYVGLCLAAPASFVLRSNGRCAGSRRGRRRQHTGSLVQASPDTIREIT
jgi:hypothetical protein